MHWGGITKLINNYESWDPQDINNDRPKVFLDCEWKSLAILPPCCLFQQTQGNVKKIVKGEILRAWEIPFCEFLFQRICMLKGKLMHIADIQPLAGQTQVLSGNEKEGHSTF